MGNFYTNFTVRNFSQTEVAASVSGHSCIVTPAVNDSVVVFDEASDEQDQQIISGFAEELSTKLKTQVWAVMNHDDDILWYQIYDSGVLEDEYNSSPNYFDNSIEEPSGPTGGDARKLCSLIGASDVKAVERILRKSGYDEDGYAFEVDRHNDLVVALNMPTFAVGTSYASFSEGELPDGLFASQIVHTK